MARPKKETIEIDKVYLVDALLLAGQYAGMLAEKKYFEEVYQGVELYTEEMAISDLMGSCYSDMERVQSSNISKPAERIGILLADGYVDRKNDELYAEAVKNREEYEKICEKIDIVEVALQERMEERTREIFSQLYIKQRSFSGIYYAGQICHPQMICRERDRALMAIAEEIEFRQYAKGNENGKEE